MDNLFLTEEYKHVSQFHLQTNANIASIIKQSYLMNSGLLAILAYAIKNINTDVDLFYMLVIFLSLSGIIICYESAISLVNCRKREIWIYNKSNIIRNILLSDNIDNTDIAQYLKGEFGVNPNMPLKISWEYFKKSESFSNIKILIVFSTLWFILLNYILFCINTDIKINNSIFSRLILISMIIIQFFIIKFCFFYLLNKRFKIIN